MRKQVSGGLTMNLYHNRSPSTVAHIAQHGLWDKDIQEQTIFTLTRIAGWQLRRVGRDGAVGLDALCEIREEPLRSGRHPSWLCLRADAGFPAILNGGPIFSR